MHVKKKKTSDKLKKILQLVIAKQSLKRKTSFNNAYIKAFT